MAFVKALKNKAYFKRFQVKYRRRRQGKTDYAARRALVLQDKNKYNAHKHRFVVRITNSKIITQVVYSTIEGDRILAAADSNELPRYGIQTGLTNYAAAYATGLLLARRLLKKLSLDTTFEGVKDADGADYHVEEAFSERRPFKCLLDVGIVRTTIGNRVFGAMKGACDGGLHIPHSEKRFPGFDKEEESFDPEKHRHRIFGIHVADYMQKLKEEDPERYHQQFSEYVKKKINPQDLEKLYREAHAKIRKAPEAVASKSVKYDESKRIRQGQIIKTMKSQYQRNKKLTKAERQQRVQQKIQMVAAQLEA